MTDHTQRLLRWAASLIIGAVLTALIFSCSSALGGVKKNTYPVDVTDNPEPVIKEIIIRPFTYERCQYLAVIVPGRVGASVVHKGNCTNYDHRRPWSGQ